MNGVDLGVSALWAPAAIGLIFGIAAPLLVRRFSDLDLLRQSLKQLSARSMELFLFMDDPVLILRTQRDLLAANVRIVRAVGLPLVLVLIAAIPALALLDACCARAALEVNRPAVVTVQLKKLADVSLGAPPEIEVETAGVRILSQSQISWRILPVAATTAYLTLTCKGGSTRKRIVSGPGFHFLSARRGGLLNCSELPFHDPEIEWIEIDYPRVLILGQNWLVWFFAFSFTGSLLGLLF